MIINNLETLKTFYQAKPQNGNMTKLAKCKLDNVFSNSIKI